ncbi:MAG: EpsI family protein [Burkholderiales bacterium]|nr:EpsI family protein [Burkholderiales bacterium]
MSTQFFAKPVAIGMLMLVAAGLTVAATPTKRMADMGPRVDLERMIPESFDGWQIDRSIVPILPSPDVQAKLDQLYNQTLARTYVNQRGDRVMLSIAYGGDQGDATRAHRPEVCYTAQGFQISDVFRSAVQDARDRIPVVRLVARQGVRQEPITYWMKVGDQTVTSSWEQKRAQLVYGLSGRIPDGILVRVSSIGADPARSYELHDAFIRTFLAAIKPDQRARIIGRFGG